MTSLRKLTLPAGLALLAVLLAGPVQAAADPLDVLAGSLPKSFGAWNYTGDYFFRTAAGMMEYLGPRAALILGYDCRKLLVRRYTDGTDTITLEAFAASGGPEAFGLFSNFRTDRGPDLGPRASLEGRQLYLWQGRYFLTLAGDGLADGDLAAVQVLGTAVAAALKEEGREPDLLRALPAEGRREDSILYFHHQASLDTRYVLADEKVLALDGSTEGALAEYDRNGGRVTLMVFRYPTGPAADRVFRALVKDLFPKTALPADGRISGRTEFDGFSGASRSGRFLFLVIDADDDGICLSLLVDSARAAAVFGRP